MKTRTRRQSYLSTEWPVRHFRSARLWEKKMELKKEPPPHGMQRAEPNPLSKNICAKLAGQGWLPELQWSQAQGAPWNENVATMAAAGGHVRVLQWLLDNG